jgi:hypothetical protein
MALIRNRAWSQVWGDEAAKKFGLPGGGRCFRLAFKWVALTVAGENFFASRHLDQTFFETNESELKKQETYGNKNIVRAKWRGPGMEAPRVIELIGGKDWEYDDRPPYEDLVRNPWKSGSKADAYKQAVTRAKSAGPNNDEEETLGRMRDAEFEVLQEWVAHRNRSHQQRQLAVDGEPLGGPLPDVLSRFNDTRPIGLLISGGKVDLAKSTGFGGHAVAYFREKPQALARMFNPASGEFIEERIGDVQEHGGLALKTVLNFEWPKYRSYRIRLIS